MLVAGAVLLACGMALTPFMGSGFGLILSLGLLASIGSGLGSFSVLIGAASRRLPAEARGKAAGVVNAGGSMGQFVFAPIAQALIQAIGWMAALWSMAAMALAALPLVRTVAARDAVSHTNPTAGESPWRALAGAFKDNSYVLLNLGFFTCGFHIAFLVTHLPQEVNLCGLPPTVSQLVARDYRACQHRRQPRRRPRDRTLPQQIHPRVDVRLARGADCDVPRRAEDGAHLLSVRRRAGRDLARDRPRRRRRSWASCSVSASSPRCSA